MLHVVGIARPFLSPYLSFRTLRITFLLRWISLRIELCGGLAHPGGFAWGHEKTVGCSSDSKKPIARPHKTQEQQNRRHAGKIGHFVLC
jgi:hypothetical protein